LNYNLRCLHGKIEEVTLPVPRVDIIVSEWMGYFLLFEAMLDSVIWARDHYLSETGIMVPSHATIRIAPTHDPELIDSLVTFWNSVYGFDMSCMLRESYGQAFSRSVPSEVLAAEDVQICRLDLNTASVADLTFLKEFSFTVNKDIDSLDAWVIWFDMFFLPSRDSVLPENATAIEMVKNGTVAFTTGPAGKDTHWRQGIMILNRNINKPSPVKKGVKITGQVGYKKPNPMSRSLEVEVIWQEEGREKRGHTWIID
jgi:protein arginine N-methyltransferase 3